MTQAIKALALTFGDQFPRLRARRVAPVDKRVRTIGVARTHTLLRHNRANPELRNVPATTGVFDRWLSVWHNRQVQRRWQRELNSLDERQLRDIGVSRYDAEQATQRINYWI